MCLSILKHILSGRHHIMEKRLLCGEEVSLLGFGAMRLPTQEDGTIDRVKAGRLVDTLYQNGVNYFDTAYVYHQGESEEFLGEALRKYPRDSFYLATKTPGHLINPDYDPVEAFERQLWRCETDYFDFYLLHNVMESSLPTYTDPDLRVMDYLLEQKAKGHIRHLGISSHGQLPMLERYMKAYGKEIEFVQLQINYLDWSLQQAKEKYELITNLGLPIIVMEPCRGGSLAALDAANEQKMKTLRPQDSVPSWAFRFVGSLPNVSVVLSGMSSMEQVEDNLKTFCHFERLSETEQALLADIARSMMDIVPCTACRYCCDGCPVQLDIPYLLKIYNDAKFSPTVMNGMLINALPKEAQPAACIGCGACAQVCPQHIDIPAALADLTKIIAEGPDWAKVSAERLKLDRK